MHVRVRVCAALRYTSVRRRRWIRVRRLKTRAADAANAHARPREKTASPDNFVCSLAQVLVKCEKAGFAL